MEVIGLYKVRELSKGESVIKTPPGAWGSYILVQHEDGSFTYKPTEGQIIPAPRTFRVREDTNTVAPVAFLSEKDALKYKEKMEKLFGRAFRMEKVFPSNGKNKKLGEQK